MDSLMEEVYDRSMAAALVRGAAAAYGDDREMEAWAERQGCDGCQVVRDERTDTLGFVAVNQECGFVVFRGTRDLRNWITDLDCKRVAMDSGSAVVPPGVEVHEGFQRALDSVWPRMAEAMGRMAGGRGDLFFAGHSLGGALAMLAMARWDCELKIKNLQLPIAGWLYSFGQPRVGNGAWARWYDGRLRGRSFRVVHAEDVVARVPWLLGRFRHAGTEIFYDALGVEHVDWPWWAKAPSDAAGLWMEWRKGKVALLGDHQVNTYVGMLCRVLNAECRMQNAECRVQSAEGRRQKAESFLRRS